jgi:hypothetical protein
VVDLRLLVLARRVFKAGPSVRDLVIIDQIRATMGCTEAQAREHLEDLENGRYVLVRGSGTDRLVFPGPNLDSTQLRRMVADKFPQK